MKTQKLFKDWKSTEIFDIIKNELKTLNKEKICLINQEFRIPKDEKQIREFTKELESEMRKMGFEPKLMIFDTGCAKSEIVFSDGDEAKSIILENRTLGYFNSIFFIEIVSHPYWQRNMDV